jgi:putative methionine-R-sulfoxide reductase with GAF domain
MDVDSLYRFPVPAVVPGTEGVACSKDLDDELFDLGSQVYGFPPPFGLRGSGGGGEEQLGPPFDRASHAMTFRLARLREIVVELQSGLGADWVGIYRLMDVPQFPGQRTLVKESYVGAPSRPFFPLESLRGQSNNVECAVTGQIVLVEDVMSHEGQFYECDGRVLSECCAPIVDENTNEVLGIIDAESFTANWFTPERVSVIESTCRDLAASNLCLDILSMGAQPQDG